jgi:rhodanese-related sulfurtransferase
MSLPATAYSDSLIPRNRLGKGSAMNLLTKLLGRRTADAVEWVETAELATLLKGTSPPAIIDVRGAGEFTGPLGHIDSAVNIPLDELQAHTAELLAEPRALVLVCHTDRRSSAAAQHLRRAGRAEVAVLRGGMVAWRA